MAMQFLLEGQEEIGSPNLAELLQENAELLRADIALSADGGQISPEHVSGLDSVLALLRLPRLGPTEVRLSCWPETWPSQLRVLDEPYTCRLMHTRSEPFNSKCRGCV